jgi:hypothetical protein
VRINQEFSDIVETARIHYENLKTDISNAHNRVEHIRLTALAQEAHNLYVELRSFNAGLVYTHTAERTHQQILEESMERENQLDLPEFKSPYTPPLRLE